MAGRVVILRDQRGNDFHINDEIARVSPMLLAIVNENHFDDPLVIPLGVTTVALGKAVRLMTCMATPGPDLIREMVVGSYIDFLGLQESIATLTEIQDVSN